MTAQGGQGVVDVAALQRRTLWVVTVSQMFGGAGLAAGVTVGALLAKDMMGGDSVAGLPIALFTLGSAAAAFLIGRFSQHLGRRVGLGVGFATGALGAAGVIAAAAIDSVWLLMVSLLVYGSGSASNLQARYAGTDLAEPAHRGRAVSIAMVATTLGAVVGPVVVEPMGSLAERLGLPTLTGTFILAGVAYGVAGVILFALLRPDPFLVALTLGHGDEVPTPERTGTRVAGRLQGRVYLGAAVMILSQMAMVAIMTMTPVYMHDHGHGLGDVGVVIGFHIGAMYLPSPLTGALVDRFGRGVVVAATALVLVVSGVLAAVLPASSVPAMVVALAVLGLGWNMGLISGTALVVDATDPVERPRVQGVIDVGVALAGAGGGAISGVVVAQSSYGVLTIASGLVSLAVIPVLVMAGRR